MLGRGGRGRGRWEAVAAPPPEPPKLRKMAARVRGGWWEVRERKKGQSSSRVGFSFHHLKQYPVTPSKSRLAATDQ